MSKVDIIVPVYKVEKFLRRCLDSIQGQTYSDWRAICVNDGSPDSCPDILKEYAQKDNRFFIINKENGGLSDARNKGLDAATAEFIVFIDSDDFIHPQTLEIAIGLAERDGSDMVTWYRDSSYRNHQIKLLRKLGKDTINAKPWRFNKVYSIDKIRSYYTENLIGHCSDWKHPKFPWAIKHCHVFKLLIRRECIKDIHFIKGLNFEDIPWWSEVIMQKMKVTITHLPLYYYYPNEKSIVKTTTQASVIIYLLRGITHSYDLYKERATAYQMERWSRHIKWAILRGLSKKLRHLDDVEHTRKVRIMYENMWNNGVFDDYKTLSNKRAYIRIAHFLGKDYKNKGIGVIPQVFIKK